MFTRDLLINRVDDIKRFNYAAEKCDFDISLISDKYIINAKSLMGILSLDLSKPVRIVAYTEDKRLADAFFNAISDLLQ